MALVDSSIDGTMTVIVLDKDERDALDTILADLAETDSIPGMLHELWQAL